jgi:hypothetical protein
MAFLNVAEREQISASMVVSPKFNELRQAQTAAEDSAETSKAESSAIDPTDPAAKEKMAKQTLAENEQRALDRGLTTLEALFPKAGWDHLSDKVDLYPYFQDVFKLQKDYALIAPTDALQQVAILVRILEELFFGLRFVSFGVVIGSDGNPDRVEDVLGPILNNWHYYIDNSFEKEYLPRLAEYCRILENTAESRTSAYAKRLLNELHWAKRLFFLPYYKFESAFPPPFQKNEVVPLYPEIRTLRRYLTAVANGIEQGNRHGGAAVKAACDGIDNPWEPYVFQVPNPVSKRLNALLGEGKRTNAALIFYTLAVSVVLDYLVNNEASWAYGERDHIESLFRSRDGDGVMPMEGVDTKIDADAIFNQAIRARKERANPGQ